MILQRQLLASVIAFGLSSAGACAGRIGRSIDGTERDPQRGGAPGSGGPSMPPATTDDDSTDVVGPGPAVGTRLTREEYAHSVEDVFELDATALAVIKELLPRETPSGGFRNQVGTMQASQLRTDALARAAQHIAQTLAWPRASARYASCQDPTAACRRGFVSRLGLALYRRPLAGAEVTNLTRLFDGGTADALSFEAGARLVVEAMLQSPHFLFRLERPAAPSAHELLTRLSFVLWKSSPSLALLDVASDRRLQDPTELRNVLDAMLADQRASRGLREFGEDWLQLYRLDHWAPDPKQGGTPSLVADMKEQALRFIDHAWSRESPMTTVLTQRRTELTPQLAQAVYGVQPRSKSGFVEYELPLDGRRGGILALPGVLGAHAGAQQASVIHRGLAAFRNVLCGDVPAPPDAATTDLKTIPLTLPERERLALHRADAACAACHAAFDPLGFPYEVFDLIGRYAATDEHGNVLQEGGEYVLDGQARRYANATELSQLLAQSPSVERCFVHKFVQYAFGRSLHSEDEGDLDRIVGAWRDGAKTFNSMVVAVLTDPSFRRVAGGNEP